MSPELWRWMYQSPPAGPAVIVVLESDDRLVGHYGVQPREFWISGRRTTVGFAVGTMVPPATAKRKGLGRNGTSWHMRFAASESFPACTPFPTMPRTKCAVHCWIGKRCRRSSNGMAHCRKRVIIPSMPFSGGGTFREN